MDRDNAVNDAQQIADAHRLQVLCGPRWLVMWSRWHRMFTGFACCTSKPLVIDEGTTDALFREMGRAELRFGQMISTDGFSRPIYPVQAIQPYRTGKGDLS